MEKLKVREAPNKTRSREAGFVISLEFLLVMALVVLPLMIAFILLAQKFITVYLNQRELIDIPFSKAVVWDSTNPGPAPTPKALGQVIGYDGFGAPQLIFRDAPPSATPAGTGAGFVVSARPFRLTTTSSVYYDGPNCTGNAFLKVSAPTGPWPRSSFNAQLAEFNYGIGSGNVLYRATTAAANLTAGSVWTSEDVGDASPATAPSTACVALSTVPKTFLALADEGTTRVTATTLTNHNLRSGDTVTIAGAASPGVNNYNGVFVITVTGSNTFTYNVGAPSTLPRAIVLVANATFVNVPQLANTALVVDFDGAGNYVLPFRLAFPSPGALAPVVPTGG